MTATERLRELLDERGVEYETLSFYDATWWKDACGLEWYYGEDDDGHTIIEALDPTPEQAIAATLGSGTCHAIVSDNLNESEGMGDAWADCSECGHLLFVLTDPSSEPPNYCPNCGAKVVDE